MRRAQKCFSAAVACLALAAAGCGGQPKLVPVSGEVKLDGKPAEGVRVYFWPVDQTAKTFVNRFAIGFSDKEGKFLLRGTNGDGVEAGEYKVTFARPVAGPVKPNRRANQKNEKETLPPEFTELSRTKYTATVSSTSNTFVFDLPSK
jgi:hypothetical protein